MTHLDCETYEGIEYLRKAGMSTRAMAPVFGLSPSTVARYVRRISAPAETVRGIDGKSYRLGVAGQAERVRLVAKLRAQGMSSRAIAKEVGVSQRTVMRDVERLRGPAATDGTDCSY